MKISNYRHKIIEVVKFYEVDMLGVCNNAVYFNYFEDALNIYTRVEYIKNSSFGFRHMVEKAVTKSIIAKGGDVVVHIARQAAM